MNEVSITINGFSDIANKHVAYLVKEYLYNIGFNNIEYSKELDVDFIKDNNVLAINDLINYTKINIK